MLTLRSPLWLLALLVLGCGGEEGAAPDDPSLDSAVEVSEPDSGPEVDSGSKIDSGPEVDSGPEPDAAPNPCPGVDPQLLKVYWGDLHVHTTYSMDAYWFNSLNGPDEAFAFASGEGQAKFPLDDPQSSSYEQSIDRPLDFTAVTDHAEFLGIFATACGEEPGPILSRSCDALGSYVRENIEAMLNGGLPFGSGPVTGAFPTSSAWERSKEAAEAHNQDCEFSAFAAYEFTAQPGEAMIHRNVIFIGEELPEEVISSLDVEDEWGLFDALESVCREGGHCDFLTLPHNSNLSDGKMFRPSEDDDLPLARGGERLTMEDAAKKAFNDVAVEVVQHKGQSECLPGYDLLGGEEADIFCGFELYKPICTGAVDDPEGCREICETVGLGEEPSEPSDCTNTLDTIRAALVDGLRMRPLLNGINPYKLGFVGATDSHNGTPGNVLEERFRGHAGVLDSTPELLLGAWSCDPQEPSCEPEWNQNGIPFQPGGLTGVWAPRNTREEIFKALRQKSSYATSGPRISTRAFARWTPFPEGACALLDEQIGRTDGAFQAPAAVPMGGSLPRPPQADSKPNLLVWAHQDPGGERWGTPLNRIQIIKGWVDPSGLPRAKIIHLTGEERAPHQLPQPNEGCEVPPDAGPERLCGVWRDEEFEPGQDVYYYARILENPSCRWNTWLCVKEQVECAQLELPTRSFPQGSAYVGYEGCCEPSPEDPNQARLKQELIQERAWTSPFWYEVER